MKPTTKEFLTDRMAHFIQDQLLGFKDQEMEKKFKPSLTISRQLGAGMDRIKQPLLEYLDEVDDTDEASWALFDQSLLGQIIAGRRLDRWVGEYHSENSKFPVLEVLETHLNLNPVEWTLFNHTANVIRNLCSAGHAVIVGRAGNFVASDLANVFHVRLVGSKKKRIKEISHQFNTTEEKAREIVEESDRARSCYVKRYTGSNIDDLEVYDVVINTDNLNDELLVRLIADSLLEWAHQKEESTH